LIKTLLGDLIDFFLVDLTTRSNIPEQCARDGSDIGSSCHSLMNGHEWSAARHMSGGGGIGLPA
jgi:hypothetical protein